MGTSRTTRSTAGKGATSRRGSARAQAAEAEQWEEVKSADFPDTWNFDDEPELVGTYLGSKDVDTKHGSRVVHQFDVEGVAVDAWGASILNSRLEDIDPGTTVKVIKTGNSFPTKRGKPAQEYKVLVKKGAVATGRR